MKICIICSGTEWTSVDHLRSKPANMVVCNSCGFITFKRFTDDSEYHNYYDQEYRKGNIVGMSNLITTNRKIGYHESFIGKLLSDKKDQSICDIGSGIGYFLRYCRDKYGHKDVVGVELTSSFRRYAKNAFGIDSLDKFDDTRKYDLVSCYHTLEHIPDPIQLLNQIKTSLKPDGKFYVATPVWMEEFMKFGGGVFGTENHPFDEHFHPDHVNAWSRWHLHELLEKTGWKIVKEDRCMYGTTLLLEPFEQRDYKPPEKGSKGYPWKNVPVDVITQLSDMRRSATAFMKGEMAEAMRLYPPFPDAILAEVGNSFKDLNRQMELSRMGETLCPNTRIFSVQRGLVLFQRQQYDEAEKELAYALEKKPHDDNILLHLGLICLKKGEKLVKTDYKTGKELLKKAVSTFDIIASVNPGMFPECFNYQAYAMSICPLEEEMSTNGNGFTCPHAEEAPHVSENELKEIKV